VLFSLSATGFATIATTRAAPTAKPAHSAPKGLPKGLSKEGHRVVSKVREILHAKVSSPGGQMKLNIVPGAHPERGEFREISAIGAPAKVRKLEITSIHITARDVRIKVADMFRENKIRTTTAKTTLRAVVTDNDLTRYLGKGNHTRDMGLQVRFMGKATRVTGNFKWQWFSGPVEGYGRLRLGDDCKVYFDILTLKLNGKAVPDWLKVKFSEKINPIIDYDEVPFRPQFKRLQIQGDRAILTA